jgi:CubicO group peptidase (beta-lactamase class C family)
MYNVTVRQLLHMTSGIGDFDSRDARLRLFKEPANEFDLHQVLSENLPLANLERTHLHQKTDPSDSFTCFPGKCGEYSSTNYLLLGMILTQARGLQHWSEYDQSAFLPQRVRQKMPSTIFPLRGALRDFTGVHAYPLSLGLRESPLFQNGVLDAIGLSANMAFTVANGLSTGPDMAVFWQALLGKGSEILNPKSRSEMMKLRWLETGLGNKVSTGQFYGMGVRDLSGQLIVNPVKAIFNPEIYFSGKLFGHDGASAAGYNSFSVYVPRYDYGLSFIMNDQRAAVLFNFMARKAYDIAIGLTKPVDAPLQAELENKDAFMSQPWIQKIKQMKLVKS